jgi:hypothetical protein
VRERDSLVGDANQISFFAAVSGVCSGAGWVFAARFHGRQKRVKKLAGAKAILQRGAVKSYPHTKQNRIAARSFFQKTRRAFSCILPNAVFMN